MSVGVFELEEDPAAVARARGRVGAAAAAFASGHQRATTGVRRTRERWTGPRSEIFDAAAQGVVGLLVRARAGCADVEGALATLTEAVRRTEDELAHLKAQHDALPLHLETGAADLPGVAGEAQRRARALCERAAALARDLHRTEQHLAHQIDAVTSRLLPHQADLPATALTRQVASGIPVPSGSGLEQALARLAGALLVGPDGAVHAAPGAGASAVDVHAWWTGLTPGQREGLLRTCPTYLGNLDGIPTLDRDTANRIVLPRELAEMRAELAGLAAGPDEQSRRELRLRITGSEAILAALGDDREGAPYLLGYQPRTGNGRAIVAVGDPDRSVHTVLYVPGTLSSLGTVGEGIHRAGAIHAAVRRHRPSGPVATLAWYGYDAPPSLASAASTGYADHGAPLLDRFLRGLSATSTTPRRHVTVSAHSYGTTLVGRAGSHGRRLLADDVFLLASPGMGVGSGWAGGGLLRGTVDDLHLRGPSRGHVFASTARDDPIRWVRGTHLGEDPVDAASGVIAVGATPTGHHDSYFVDGNPALLGLGLVGAGHRDLVRPATHADNASPFDDAPAPRPLGPLLPGWPDP